MAETGQRRRRGRVLVVDDEPHMVTILSRILSHLGYQVLWARDGSDALQLARHYRDTIDLLVTDVKMPDLTGPELAAGIREIHPEMRVLFASGCGPAELRRYGLDPQADPLLPKPYGSDGVRLALQRVLG